MEAASRKKRGVDFGDQVPPAICKWEFGIEYRSVGRGTD